MALGSMCFPASSGYRCVVPADQGQRQEPACAVRYRQRHLPTKQGDDHLERYTCPKCGRSYRHLHHMVRHCKFECGSPPRFQCPYCGMRSKQSNNVYKHIRIKHPGSKLEVVVLQYDQQ